MSEQQYDTKHNDWVGRLSSPDPLPDYEDAIEALHKIHFKAVATVHAYQSVITSGRVATESPQGKQVERQWDEPLFPAEDLKSIDFDLLRLRDLAMAIPGWSGVDRTADSLKEDLLGKLEQVREGLRDAGVESDDIRNHPFYTHDTARQFIDQHWENLKAVVQKSREPKQVVHD